MKHMLRTVDCKLHEIIYFVFGGVVYVIIMEIWT
jgi:hypothetical protein